MGELLLITNIEDDIIFKKEFDIMNDKEYCSLFMLGYSSLDIIEEIRFSTVKTFFKSLDTQSKWDVSVYFLPSGFKLIYINEDSEEKRVYDFMSKIHILLRKVSFIINLRLLWLLCLIIKMLLKIFVLMIPYLKHMQK
ncbi:hypothetical protein CWI37_0066p0030 [Hamiltosporidium tvaerminnensis]|uniref:Uncharacterized protein n=2 Tax=Hamiltosporidium TaxID=1176354 RepID=A0A4Q9L725_9MICR|nr:hypothetical protein CWI36_0923p0030 [Hamiltosporidium magnivora]TBU04966.1 hypothetical protein CWI37_0066p0030 [Hamiltosporidium tvaerminnensis]